MSLARRRLFWAVLGLALTCVNACTVVSPLPRKAYVYDIQALHQDAKPNRSARLTENYLLKPYDQLDVIFHFDQQIIDSYLLQVSDEIEIKFLGASELSAAYRIRPDGFISLPYLGEIRAVGYSTQQLARDIQHYYVGILKDPEVFISLRTSHRRLKDLKASLTHPQTGFSRIISVRPDARISLPLIGDIDTDSVSVDLLNRMVNTRYHHLHPAVNVDLILKEAGATNIFVLGEVNRPGAYPINSRVTILQALSFAGGVNARSNIRTVIAIRRQNDEVVARVFDVHNILEGTEGLVEIEPNDTIYVSRSRLSKASEVARQLADVALFNGWGTGLSFSYRIDDKARQEN